jgi:hypothetical protein
MRGRNSVWKVVFLIGLLLGSWWSPIQAADLSPDLHALTVLIQELVEADPPMDPADLGAIVADTNAALTNTSGSTDPYDRIPESLYAARLGMRVANLLYHRHGSPQDASSVLTQVQSLYAAYPTGTAMASSLGARSAKTGSLPPNFSPASVASSTDPCPPMPSNSGAIYDTGKSFLETKIESYDPQDGGVFTCDPALGGFTGERPWVLYIPSGSGVPLRPVLVWVYGPDDMQASYYAPGY